MDQSIPDGSVVITPTEMYRELRATHDEVRALGPVLQALTEKVDDKIGDHETRIRSLESAKWRLVGGVTALSAVASFVATRLGS